MQRRRLAWERTDGRPDGWMVGRAGGRTFIIIIIIIYNICSAAANSDDGFLVPSLSNEGSMDVCVHLVLFYSNYLLFIYLGFIRRHQASIGVVLGFGISGAYGTTYLLAWRVFLLSALLYCVF